MHTPAALICGSQGRKMVTIVDPHVKREFSYPIFKEAEEKGYYVKNKHGSDFDGCGCCLAASDCGSKFTQRLQHIH